MVTEEGPTGKPTKVKRQRKLGAYVYLDEGQALGEMGNRKGATLLPTLRSAWSGQVLGQANATQDTYRVLLPHTYRLAILVGFQAEYAQGLLDDAAGGTPQRFVFAAATDNNIPNDPPEWPGPLPVPNFDVIHGGEYIEVDPEVAKGIRARNLAAARGETDIDPLDSHRDLSRLKVAAILGVIDGRKSVTQEDWKLAGMVMRASSAVRQWVLEVSRKKATEAETVYTKRAVRREIAVENAVEERALISGAKSLARKVHNTEGVATKGVISRAVASKHKQIVSLDEMIFYAIEQGWIEAQTDGWAPGKSKPR
jgi:hypothetical protein